MFTAVRGIIEMFTPVSNVVMLPIYNWYYYKAYPGAETVIALSVVGASMYVNWLH